MRLNVHGVSYSVQGNVDARCHPADPPAYVCVRTSPSALIGPVRGEETRLLAAAVRLTFETSPLSSCFALQTWHLVLHPCLFSKTNGVLFRRPSTGEMKTIKLKRGREGGAGKKSSTFTGNRGNRSLV